MININWLHDYFLATGILVMFISGLFYLFSQKDSLSREKFRTDILISIALLLGAIATKGL